MFFLTLLYNNVLYRHIWQCQWAVDIGRCVYILSSSKICQSSITRGSLDLYRVAKKNPRKQSIFRTLLWSPVIIFTLLDRPSFPHYNSTKIIKFGWELFILWVISYGLSFSGFARFPEFRGTINDKWMANPKNEITHKIKKISTKLDDLGVIIMRKRCSIQQDEKG